MPQQKNPNQIWKRTTDPREFDPVIEMTPSSFGDPGSDYAQMRGNDAQRAHDQAVRMGGFLTTKERKGRSFGGGPVDPNT